MKEPTRGTEIAAHQVEITCNGDLPTALDWIEIDYRHPDV